MLCLGCACLSQEGPCVPPPCCPKFPFPLNVPVGARGIIHILVPGRALAAARRHRGCESPAGVSTLLPRKAQRPVLSFGGCLCLSFVLLLFNMPFPMGKSLPFFARGGRGRARSGQLKCTGRGKMLCAPALEQFERQRRSKEL